MRRWTAISFQQNIIVLMLQPRHSLCQIGMW